MTNTQSDLLRGWIIHKIKHAFDYLFKILKIVDKELTEALLHQTPTKNLQFSFKHMRGSIYYIRNIYMQILRSKFWIHSKTLSVLSSDI